MTREQIERMTPAARLAEARKAIGQAGVWLMVSGIASLAATAIGIYLAMGGR